MACQLQLGPDEITTTTARLYLLKVPAVLQKPLPSRYCKTSAADSAKLTLDIEVACIAHASAQCTSLPVRRLSSQVR